MKYIQKNYSNKYFLHVPKAVNLFIIVYLQIQQEKEALVSEKVQLTEEKDKMNRELVESKASLQQKDIQVEELQKEVYYHSVEF